MYSHELNKYPNNQTNNLSNANSSGPTYSAIPNHIIEERQDVIFRKVRGILNKITPETFDKLSKELVNVGLNSPRTLRGVIYLLFDKALKDLKYSSLYAKLCQELSEKAPNFEQDLGPNTFCKFLISKCEDEFERRRRATEDFDSKNELTDEEYEQRAVAKQKMLGNIKFICELGKKRLLQEEILHECIRGLLSKKKERPIQDQAQDLECLCQIMRTIGSLLDIQASRNLMNQYFERIDMFSKKPELPSRIRFMLRDVIDLRNNNWRPRPFQREDNVPQTLSKLREEAGFDLTNSSTFDGKFGNNRNPIGLGDLPKLHGNLLIDDEPSFTTTTDFHWGPSFLPIDQSFDAFSSSSATTPARQQTTAVPPPSNANLPISSPSSVSNQVPPRGISEEQSLSNSRRFGDLRQPLVVPSGIGNTSPPATRSRNLRHSELDVQPPQPNPPARQNYRPDPRNFRGSGVGSGGENFDNRERRIKRQDFRYQENETRSIERSFDVFSSSSATYGSRKQTIAPPPYVNLPTSSSSSVSIQASQRGSSEEQSSGNSRRYGETRQPPVIRSGTVNASPPPTRSRNIRHGELEVQPPQPNHSARQNYRPDPRNFRGSGVGSGGENFDNRERRFKRQDFRYQENETRSIEQSFDLFSYTGAASGARQQTTTVPPPSNANQQIPSVSTQVRQHGSSEEQSFSNSRRFGDTRQPPVVRTSPPAARSRNLHHGELDVQPPQPNAPVRQSYKPDPRNFHNSSTSIGGESFDNRERRFKRQDFRYQENEPPTLSHHQNYRPNRNIQSEISDKRDQQRKFYPPQDQEHQHSRGHSDNGMVSHHNHHHHQERNYNRTPIGPRNSQQFECSQTTESDKIPNWRKGGSSVGANVASNTNTTPVATTTTSNTNINSNLNQNHNHNPNHNLNSYSYSNHNHKSNNINSNNNNNNVTKEHPVTQNIAPLLPKPSSRISDTNSFSLRPSHNLIGRASSGLAKPTTLPSQPNTNVDPPSNDNIQAKIGNLELNGGSIKTNIKPVSRFQPEIAQALPHPSTLPPVKVGSEAIVHHSCHSSQEQGESRILGGSSPTRDILVGKFTSILLEFSNNSTPAHTNVHRIAAKIKELKIPKNFQHECLVSAMKQSILKTENDRDNVGKLFVQLIPSTFEGASLLNAFKIIFEQMHALEVETPKVKSLVAGFLSRAILDNLLTLEEVANVLAGGKHHPLFLLFLQKLEKNVGQAWLNEKFTASKINLIDMLPEVDRSKDRLANILKDRCLGFLDPMLTIEPDLWAQMKERDPSPAAVYRWIKDNVDQTIQNTPTFAHVLISCLLKYIHNIANEKSKVSITEEGGGADQQKTEEIESRSNKSSPSSSSQSTSDVENEILTKYQQVLQAILKDKHMQLATLYSLQSFYHGLDFPKGSLLRWFHMLYDMNIVDDDVFFIWKEEINDEFPGKGQALFQVNTWLNWLAEAESEEEEELES